MPYWRLFYHVVWATKDRLPLIVPEKRLEVHRVLADGARKDGIIVHAVGGVEDHIHLAVSIPPALSIATVVGRIKGRSSHTLSPLFDGSFGWQAEYGVISFSERDLPRVVAYMENQVRHHQSGTLWPTLEHVGESGD
ncbi:MAG TPA: IS200/IS605 family transposase, partial [Nitrolancea sp.]|nr:IS200/IS605 family transposase [Nitrolancea sp.]